MPQRTTSSPKTISVHTERHTEGRSGIRAQERREKGRDGREETERRKRRKEGKKGTK